MQREKLGSRLGFILISAGCAIGIGNVWKFPYLCGQSGGGIFVLVYLFFLVILGLPAMTMEFAAGRAAGKSPVMLFRELEPKGTKWHLHGYVCMAGNYLLMMYYSTVAGWMLQYFFRTAAGSFEGMEADLIMVILAVNSVFLPGADKGLSFYLLPSAERAGEIGIFQVIANAMNQAFFTLSIGIGSMAIFGSYIGRDQALMGESINVIILDTFVAICSGLIIFPACFAYGVQPDSGPGLIFITLPNIFNHMKMGRLWGSLFFVFMTFAAFSTVLAVFENIMAMCMDQFGWSRKKSGFMNAIIMFVCSLPCALGFNIWSSIQPLGQGSTVLDFEDMIVSNYILPVGAFVFVMFCTNRYGWGWDRFVEEANEGSGAKVQRWMRPYVTYVLPLIVVLVFILGLI